MNDSFQILTPAAAHQWAHNLKMRTDNNMLPNIHLQGFWEDSVQQARKCGLEYYPILARPQPPTNVPTAPVL
jgi:hypothetical protein